MIDHLYFEFYVSAALGVCELVLLEEPPKPVPAPKPEFDPANKGKCPICGFQPMWYNGKYRCNCRVY